jgi:hypothetical protein
MIFEKSPLKEFNYIKQLVLTLCRRETSIYDHFASISTGPALKGLIDTTDNDCDVFENTVSYFQNLRNIHLNLNRLSFLSEKFVNQIEYLTSLSLSDNPTLKSWDPFINRLGKLQYLEELILNNCSIDQIESQNS